MTGAPEHDLPVFALPSLVDTFAEQRVLVVAPHMDDEVIGCGGAIMCHIDAAATVTTVFLTDGEVGRPSASARTVRHDEARSVADYLKMQPPRFLDGPDTELAVVSPLVEALAATIDDTRPDLIYAPWIGDAHRDHVVANALLTAAGGAASMDLSPTIVRSYEVWTPVPANVSVDISTRVNRKLQALQRYQSQFVAHDPAPLLGLNRYRSMTVVVPGATHVECFRQAEWVDYCRHSGAWLSDGGTGS